MKLFIYLIYIVLGCNVLMVSCGKKSKGEITAPVPEKGLKMATGFQLPVIPDTIYLPESRKEFLLKHYWDKFPFHDTIAVFNRDMVNEGCMGFLGLMSEQETPLLIREKAWNVLTEQLANEERACEVFSDFMREYLFDSNSPGYDELLYAEFLQSLSEHIDPNDVRQSTFRFRLELIRRNLPGSRASDFTYCLPDGKKSTLSRTKVQGNRLLLLFYDPECGHCEEIIGQIENDETLAQAVQAGKASVLAVYTEGNDSVWRASVGRMPVAWQVVTDHEQIKEHALYDLKAMPTLYLLDGNKRVLLKDAPYAIIKEHLRD